MTGALKLAALNLGNIADIVHDGLVVLRRILCAAEPIKCPTDGGIFEGAGEGAEGAFWVEGSALSSAIILGRVNTIAI